jgi:periplasmic divalent cation tolerance protein
MDKNFIVVMVTCSSSREAKKIAGSLLDKRLVACANIVPDIGSRFWWKGKIENAREVLVIMKTKTGNFNKIESEVKKLHSYEVPEIIAIPIVMGNRQYIKWIKDETDTHYAARPTQHGR